MPELRELVAAELSLPVDPRVTAIASAIAERHGTASRAVLFYGSCLREKQLKKWNRAWKFRLVEASNPYWHELYPDLFS